MVDGLLFGWYDGADMQKKCFYLKKAALAADGNADSEYAQDRGACEWYGA